MIIRRYFQILFCLITDNPYLVHFAFVGRKRAFTQIPSLLSLLINISLSFTLWTRAIATSSCIFFSTKKWDQLFFRSVWLVRPRIAIAERDYFMQETRPSVFLFYAESRITYLPATNCMIVTVSKTVVSQNMRFWEANIRVDIVLYWICD